MKTYGEKLSILFIVHGVPGGSINNVDQANYPDDHFYNVHELAWMDQRVRKKYLEMLPS
ncbi:hypothetical protein H310_13056 [Aphanomyces invadans]|uniref:Uncharacterized protein n=1 Tax=Aphanomyces invadans TaxID=157072 RepID=A0A024TEX9_9STRA|nr:hypothetical protein H310_13056 [Aphanomyces invadans]ETV92598.1 hypothetical protein H310_13056 [Aphanomyces invadans]|eukprot:XP_008878634.1 hypothetical protein H310_13056 [Aphanomyces invadans]